MARGVNETRAQLAAEMERLLSFQSDILLERPVSGR